MKILYFHQYFSTPAGYAGTRSYAMAKALVEAGHKVQMFCLQDVRTHTGLTGPFVAGSRSGFVDGIEVVEFNISYSNHARLLERSLIFLRYSLQSLLLTLCSDADLIFATTTPLTAGIPGIAARWLRGIPFVFEVRDLWPELPKAMGVLSNPIVIATLSTLESISYHSADACIGLAPGICEGIAGLGIAPTRITSIPNACDLTLFHPQPHGRIKRPELIQGLIEPLSSRSFVAAFTGAHGQANGLDAVLDMAAELILSGRNDIKILFIGDGRCKLLLQQRVELEGLHNCHFLPFVSKPELAKMLRQSVHLGLMVLSDIPAFYRGTSPNKFFDYLACGLPVVNNYPGWLADLINEHQLGRSVPPRNPAAFAEALIELAGNPDQLASMCANARDLAELQFSRDLLAEKWCKVLERTERAYTRRRSNYLSHLAYSLLKSLADRLVALLALVMFSPIFVLVILFLRVHMGGPVFFRQQRPGFREQPFWLLKFRTMTKERDSSGILLPDDQRLMPFGRWLRSTSIDELPELINILRGEMSFIGPRPLLMKYLPLYSPEQASRHNVKPGISGWAQINGRNSLSWEEKFHFDIWYIENKSFYLDLRIFFITIWKVICREGISASGDATMTPFKGSNN